MKRVTYFWKRKLIENSFSFQLHGCEIVYIILLVKETCLDLLPLILNNQMFILIIFTRGCSFEQFQNGLVVSNLCFWLWQEKWSKNQYIASICYGRTASWRAWKNKLHLHIPSRYNIPLYPTWDLLIFICYDLQGSQFWIKWWVCIVSIESQQSLLLTPPLASLWVTFLQPSETLTTTNFWKAKQISPESYSKFKLFPI